MERSWDGGTDGRSPARCRGILGPRSSGSRGHRSRPLLLVGVGGVVEVGMVLVLVVMVGREGGGGEVEERKRRGGGGGGR